MRETRRARTDETEPTQPHRVRRSTDGSTTTSTAERDAIERLQRAYGNTAVRHLVRRHLRREVSVGRPDDAYEREADRVTHRVVSDRVGSAVRRDESSTERTAGDDRPGRRTSSAPSPVTGGTGRPLPESVRARFEPAFGYEFGDVRVHPAADDLTAGLNARAVTVGRDIFFHRSQYCPHTDDGARLIAHELTHVVQQRRQGPRLGDRQVATAHTPGERVQGGFFGDLWEGVTGAATSVWEGTKAVGEAVWEGTKAVGEAVWEGTKAVGEWGWNVLKGGAAAVWDLVTEAPERIVRLLEHVATGVAGTLSWVWEGLKRLFLGGELGQWFVEGVRSGAAWVGRLFAKLVDLVGVGEVFDFVTQVVKVNTRTLTTVERTEAEKVFGDSISYWQVRIDEHSLIAALGKWFSGSGGMGVTTFHTINFTRPLATAPGNGDMGWLVHELTHVAQYEHVGSQYIGEALHAQGTLGTKAYSYNESDLATTPFAAFNREQQGEIAQTYYSKGIYRPSHPDHGLYEPRIDELRRGNI